MMSDQDVILCYFDKECSKIVEVLGHLSYFDLRNFINEIYHMRLDTQYSQSRFFKSGFSTGDLVSFFQPESGVFNFSIMSNMICDSKFTDVRVRSILISFFHKIQIDKILEFDNDGYDDIIRNASNFVFPQPNIYQRIVDESASIHANTMVMDSIKYDFKTAQYLQQSIGFSKLEKGRPYIYSKTS